MRVIGGGSLERIRQTTVGAIFCRLACVAGHAFLLKIPHITYN